MKKISLKVMLFVFAGHFTCVSSSFAGTSQIHGAWYDRNFDKLPLKKILVIGLSEKKESRQEFENSFVNVIRERGGEAETGLTVLGPDLTADKEVVKAAIKGKGFDAVMVSRLEAVEIKTDYVSGRGSFDDDYQRMYNTVYTPGYLKDSRVVVIRTKIYSSSGQLIWSAESETFDPLSIKDLVAAMAKAMGRDLSDKGLINTRSRSKQNY